MLSQVRKAHINYDAFLLLLLSPQTSSISKHHDAAAIEVGISKMLLWWFTFSFASETVTKFIARMTLCAIMKGVSSPVTTPPPLESVLLSTTASPKTSGLIPGIFDYESSVNFDNYLAALGVNYVLRKLAGLASPTVTISNSCQDAAHVSFCFVITSLFVLTTFFAARL